VSTSRTPATWSSSPKIHSKVKSITLIRKVRAAISMIEDSPVLLKGIPEQLKAILR
jgi:hypothetical protein